MSYISRGPSNDWVFLRFQWRPSWMLRKKSLVESTWHAVGTGQGAMLHKRASPAANCFLSLPSNDAQAGLLLLKGTIIRTVTCSGNIRGRKDNECGQIGVNKIPGTCNYRSYIFFSYMIMNILKLNGETSGSKTILRNNTYDKILIVMSPNVH